MVARRYRIFLLLSFLIYALVIFLEVLLMLQEYEQQLTVNTAGMSMNIFFDVQFGGHYASMYIQTAALLVTLISGTVIHIYVKNTKMFINFHQRTGYSRYLHRSMKRAFLAAFSISLATSVFEILLLSVYAHPFNPTINEKITDPLAITSVLNDHTIGNLITYIGLSAVGWGVFAMFLFAVGLFIKKTAVYMFSPAVIGYLLIFVAGFLAFFMNDQTNIVYQMIMPTSLVSPGNLAPGGVSNILIDVRLLMLLSAVFYLGLTLILTKMWEVRMKKALRE